MTALLTSLTAKASTYLVGAGIVVAAFVATYARAYLKGRKVERQKQAASDAKAKAVADEIDDAIAGRSPDANRKELGKWSPES